MPPVIAAHANVDDELRFVDDLNESTDDEVIEDVAEVVEAVEEPEADDGDTDLPPSLLDPWFAQLAHGYCPPKSIQFTRHPPPTSFPGRDEAQRTRVATGETPAVNPSVPKG